MACLSRALQCSACTHHAAVACTGRVAARRRRPGALPWALLPAAPSMAKQRACAGPPRRPSLRRPSPPSSLPPPRSAWGWTCPRPQPRPCSLPPSSSPAAPRRRRRPSAAPAGATCSPPALSPRKSEAGRAACVGSACADRFSQAATQDKAKQLHKQRLGGSPRPRCARSWHEYLEPFAPLFCSQALAPDLCVHHVPSPSFFPCPTRASPKG